jgi:mannose-1-phosphate guanylyltransferase
VILAGGVGSRFWPVSTPQHPKQLLPLASERPLIRDTIERILPLIPADRVRLIAGQAVGTALLRAAPGLADNNLMVEPAGRGTAPALTWAAVEIARRDPDAILISLHADHVIAPDAAFRDQLLDVAQLARSQQRLFTIGVAPTRPETGYGYIQTGLPLAGKALEVAKFVEKPNARTAAEYVSAGDYLWNSGIFVWPVTLFLEELRAHTPELAALVPLLETDRVDEFFATAPSISIDEALLERSQRVAVAPAEFAWDDVGAWNAVGRNRTKDLAGNVSVGDVHAIDSRGSIAWSEKGSIVLFGVEDLVVVHANGVTFVASQERTADLKQLLAQLPEQLRSLESEK